MNIFKFAINRLKRLASAPATAREGDIYYDTSENKAKLATAPDTYVDIATGGAVGTGDVLGPASATDNAIVRYNGTGGKSIQNSEPQIDDAGTILLKGSTLAGFVDTAGLYLNKTNYTGTGFNYGLYSVVGGNNASDFDTLWFGGWLGASSAFAGTLPDHPGLTGVHADAAYSGVGRMDFSQAIDFSTANTGGGTVQDAYGVVGNLYSTGASVTGQASVYKAQLAVYNTSSFSGSGPANLFYGKYTQSSSGTVPDLRGLNLSGWTKSAGTVTASYGIYMDTSIDVGTTKHAIYSLSTSPSLLSGDLNVDGAITKSSVALPSNSAGANVIPKSDGTNLVASQITDDGVQVNIVGDGSMLNGTGISVNPSGDGAIYATVSPTTFIEVEGGTSSISATAATESLTIDGTAHTATISAASTIYLDSHTGATSIGDVNDVGNSTAFTINDATTTIALNASSDINLNSANVNINGTINNVKKYVALLTQSSTDAPVPTVLENTIGEIVWTWDDNVGSYKGTLASAFPAGKTVCFIGGSETAVGNTHNFPQFNIARSSDNTVVIDSLYVTDAPSIAASDNLLLNTPVEITVYP